MSISGLLAHLAHHSSPGNTITNSVWSTEPVSFILKCSLTKGKERKRGKKFPAKRQNSSQGDSIRMTFHSGGGVLL